MALKPELEVVTDVTEGLRYLEHGWPDEICRWHSHLDYELHLMIATEGLAFIGDYIGKFQPGSLYLVGPNLPHNWVTDPKKYAPVSLRDMVIRFDHVNIIQLTRAIPELRMIQNLLEMAAAGLEFRKFDLETAQGYMAEFRDTDSLRRMAVFMRFFDALLNHDDTR